MPCVPQQPVASGYRHLPDLTPEQMNLLRAAAGRWPAKTAGSPNEGRWAA